MTDYSIEAFDRTLARAFDRTAPLSSEARTLVERGISEFAAQKFDEARDAGLDRVAALEDASLYDAGHGRGETWRSLIEAAKPGGMIAEAAEADARRDLARAYSARHGSDGAQFARTFIDQVREGVIAAGGGRDAYTAKLRERTAAYVTEARRGGAMLSESAATLTRPRTITVAERASSLSRTGARWRARLIAGDIQGSSGYYSAEMLRRDGPTAFPVNTPVYLDHPSQSEVYDRPERSVRDLAGRIVTTPAYENGGLVATVELYSWAAELVAEMADHVGLSIRAEAEVVPSTTKGIEGPIVERITRGLSVDVVTAAGAGGRFLAVLESARKRGGLT